MSREDIVKSVVRNLGEDAEVEHEEEAGCQQQDGPESFGNGPTGPLRRRRG